MNTIPRGTREGRATKRRRALQQAIDQIGTAGILPQEIDALRPNMEASWLDAVHIAVIRYYLRTAWSPKIGCSKEAWLQKVVRLGPEHLEPWQRIIRHQLR